MATTDARTGFRLPWSPDERPLDDDHTVSDETAPAGEAWPEVQPTDSGPVASPDIPEAAAVPGPETTLSETDTPAPAATPEPAPSAPPRARPSKFLAELTRAMQTAAEAAREETLGRFQGEAKAHIEEIHTRSADEAAALRRNADEDVAAIREWSKAEIARIREETENRISGRKGDLERELEAHAAAIEGRIERVHGAVSAFETEMAGFFERLLAEEDPTRFASMAEHLPEPPAFAVEADDVAPLAADVEPVLVVEAALEVEAGRPAEVETSIETPEHVEADVAPVVEAVADETPETVGDPTVAVAEPTEAVAEPVEAVAEPVEAVTEPVEADTEPGPEAVETVVEAVEREADAGETVEAVEPSAAVGFPIGSPEPTGTPEATEVEPTADVEPEPFEVDPRLAALALSGDGSDSDDTAFAGEEVEEIPVIADDALAARLAGLVAADEDPAAVQTLTTRVVVTGLVSVASIASFKRHLGRLECVRTVGVTSGPEGEFVFAVSHGPELVIRDSVPTLPGFQARVTGVEDGVVQVSAHDPEAEG